MLELRTLGGVDLRVASGAELRAVVQQPKRFALLAYLAIGHAARFVRRDTLLGLFWPELDEEHARAALRRALYFLRKSVGDATLIGRGDEEVGVAAPALWCDVVAFREALKAADRVAALSLYQGSFLEGFYVAGAPEVGDWLDRERTRLRDQALDAARQLARQPGGDIARWARRALELDEGDREMAALLDRERRSPAPHSAPGAAAPALPRTDPRLIAICPFTVRAGPGLAFLGEGMVDLLATKLDGAGDLRVVEPRLVLSGAANTGEEWDLSRGQWLARRAGAGCFVLGSVLEIAGRLEATAALHTADGALQARVEGRSESESGLFELVDELARKLLAGRHTTSADRLTRLAGLTTESLPALKAWLDGERAFRLARHLEAADSFRRATEADHSFALAWYRQAASLAASALIEPAREASLQAYRHRERLSQHDRQLLAAQHAWIVGQGAEAERHYAALVTTWPESLEGWFLLGDVQVHSNPYRGKSITGAREAFESALALDPAHHGALSQLARIAALEQRLPALTELVDRALAQSPGSDQALGLRTLRAFAAGTVSEQAELTRELASANGLTIARAFADVSLYSGDLPAAEHFGTELFAAVRSEEFRAIGLITLAHLALARGRCVEAFDRLREAERLAPAWSLETRGLFATFSFLEPPPDRIAAIRAELEDWNPASARPAVAVPLAFHNDLHPHLREFLLGVLAVRRGDPDTAALCSEALAELQVPEGADAAVQHLGRTLSAEQLRARGRPAEALGVLEHGGSDVWFQYAVASPFFAGTYERFLRAELLAESGRLPEAIGWWSAIAQRTPFELPFLAPSLQRQAAAWRQLGDPDRGADCTAKAARLWGSGPVW